MPRRRDGWRGSRTREHCRGAHAAAVRPLSPPAVRSAKLCQRHCGLGGLFNRSNRVSEESYVRPYAVAGDLMILVMSGLRFSKKAVNASFASSERTCALNSSFSAFIAALICSRNGCFMSLLLACSAAAGFDANFPAVSVALASASLSDTTWVTRPNSAARLASKGAPSKISSAARDERHLEFRAFARVDEVTVQQHGLCRRRWRRPEPLRSGASRNRSVHA
jgi:hypothetical protein